MDIKHNNNTDKGGLFSFGRNIQEMRSISETISSLRERINSLPDNKAGKKKKLENQIAELNCNYRRLLLKSIMGSGLILGVGGGIASLVRSRKSADEPSRPKPVAEAVTIPSFELANLTPIQFTQPQGNDLIETGLKMQNTWKQISFDALELFRNAGPKISELIKFMKDNSFYSLPIGPIATHHIMLSKDGNLPEDPMKKKNALEIVYMPEQFAKDMPSSILTEHGGKTIRIATTFRSMEWLGIMLAHEMSHVEDMQIKGENPNDRAQYLAGEVDAHMLEMNLLKYWNPKNYNILIEKGEPLLKAGKIQELSRLAEALYPLGQNLVSRNERALGLASCVTAIAFEVAMKKGANKEDLKKEYLRLKQLFRR